MRRGRLAFFSLFLATAGAFLTGCTEEESTTTTETEDVGPPTMEITSPLEGACIAIGDDPAARISFVLKMENLYLRSPGICGESVQCGQLILSANGKPYLRSATNVVDWDLVGVLDRYGDFLIEIAAVTDLNEPIQREDGEPLVATRNITTAISCDP